MRLVGFKKKFTTIHGNMNVPEFLSQVEGGLKNFTLQDWRKGQTNWTILVAVYSTEFTVFVAP